MNKYLEELVYHKNQGEEGESFSSEDTSKTVSGNLGEDFPKESSYKEFSVRNGDGY